MPGYFLKRSNRHPGESITRYFHNVSSKKGWGLGYSSAICSGKIFCRKRKRKKHHCNCKRSQRRDFRRGPVILEKPDLYITHKINDEWQKPACFTKSRITLTIYSLQPFLLPVYLCEDQLSPGYTYREPGYLPEWYCR